MVYKMGELERTLCDNVIQARCNGSPKESSAERSGWKSTFI